MCSTCGNSYGETGDHILNDQTWGYKGADGHAHLCTLCDYHDTPIAHLPNVDAPAEGVAMYCTESGCGYIIAQALDHEHVRGGNWEYDQLYHWQDCIANDGQKYGNAEHSFTDSCDTTCNDGCGYVRTVEHDYSLLVHAEDDHYYACSLCREEKVGSRVGHTYSGSVTTAPTTFGTGVMTYTCICKASYTKDIEPTKTLRLLAIGNSFSEDAFDHLYLICKDAGIETLVLGNLYIGGCTLERHNREMTNNNAQYIFYLSDEASGRMKAYNGGTKCVAQVGIQYADWDYITLQQASPSSGVASSYSYLESVISFVKQYKNEKSEFLWHMTWAYQQTSTSTNFEPYNYDQLTMYNAILSCVKEQVLTNPDIKGVIPSGTTIQNLRTSHLGDTLCDDGRHLSKGVGRYTAGLTYLAAITGYDVSNITAYPVSTQSAFSGYNEKRKADIDRIAPHLDCIKEAVKAAIASPYTITASVNYPYVEPEQPEQTEEPFLETELSALNANDVAYLTENGYDPSKYMSLVIDFTENHYYDSRNHLVLVKPSQSSSTYNKYIGSQLFSRHELVVGSLIRLDSNYKYRPDGWVGDSLNSASARPAQYTTPLVEITDTWWGDFTSRGFNISRADGEDIKLSEGVNFKIYVPKASTSPLTAEDEAYLTAMGFDPADFAVLDYTYSMHSYYNASQKSSIMSGTAALYYEFLCTNEKFTRYDIPLGSVIRITNSFYRYRAEGWVTLDKTVASGDRPARVELTSITVDRKWWGDWGYRAFNVQTKDNSQMTDAGASALRIYVKITSDDPSQAASSVSLGSSGDTTPLNARTTTDICAINRNKSIIGIADAVPGDRRKINA